MASPLTLGFWIEGIGTDPSRTKGTIWLLGDTPRNEGDWAWREGVVEVPPESEARVNPQTGDIEFPSYPPTLEMTRTVSQTLNARQTQKQGTINEDITASETTIELVDASAFSQDDIIYVDSETMHITSINGDKLNVDRGYFSSEALSHGKDAAVYQRPPFYQNRLLQMVGVEPDGTLHGRSFDYVEQINTKKYGTQLQIDVEAAGQKLKNAETFRYQRRYALTVSHAESDFEGPAGGGYEQFEHVDVQLNYYGDKQEILEVDLVRERDSLNDMTGVTVNQASQVAKSKDKDGNDATGQGGWYDWTVYVDTESGDGDQENDVSPYITKLTTYAGIREGFPLGCQSSDDENFLPGNSPPNGEQGAQSMVGTTSADVWEVAVWDKVTGMAPYPTDNATAISGVSNEWDPAFIAATLLFSTDSDQIDPPNLDFLDGRLGLDAGFLFGDEGKQSFIDINSDERHIDSYAVGWEGKPVNVIQRTLDLLTAHGLMLAPRTDGKLSVKDFRPLGADDVPGLSSNTVKPVFDIEAGADVWEWKPESTFGREILQGEYGFPPTQETSRLQALAIEAQSRMTRLEDPSSTELTMTHKSSSDGGPPGSVERILRRQAQFIRARMPTIRFLADDFVRPNGTDRSYDIGDWILLRMPDEVDPPLTYDLDGTPLHPVDAQFDRTFAGMIVARQWNPATNHYILECVLTNYDAGLKRLRAPAMLCAGSVSGISNEEIQGQTDSFNTGEHDAQSFTEPASSYWQGQEVVLVGPNLAPIDTTTLPTIQDVNGDTLVLSDGFTQDPTNEDMILLASYDDYQTSNSAGYVEYMFLADSNDTLGAAGDDAHEWA